MERFKVRAYGLQELAMLYFPNSTPQSASNQLKRWMGRGELPAKLTAAGYTPGQKILTPRQVEVITGHVGGAVRAQESPGASRLPGFLTSHES